MLLLIAVCLGWLLPPGLVQAAASTITAAPSSAPSNAPDYSHEAVFTSAVLNSTNFYRAEHGAQPLSWNASLESFAANYLDNDDCDFAHSGGPDGENLASGYDNVTAAVDAWGNERAEYDFEGDFSEQTGHFTQLVWKATKTVGCGRRYCGGSNAEGSNDGAAPGWFLVCEYYPRGNIVGEFTGNVSRQVSGPPGSVSLGTPGDTAPGDGSGSGGGCPQGAACDGAGTVPVPWRMAVGLALVGGAWAWW